MKRTFSSRLKQEFNRRQGLIVVQLRELGINQYLVTQPDSIYYMTGISFEALEWPFFLLIDASGGVKGRRLLVPMTELEHLQESQGTATANALTYKKYPPPEKAVRPDVGRITLATNFAFEGSVPQSMAALLMAAGGQAYDLVAKLRMVKSNWEVMQVKRAAAYALNRTAI